MNWDSFNTYNLGFNKAFEALNNQLFERYINRTYQSTLVKFRIINGAGGDGGVEAFAELKNGEIIAIQSKWFRHSLDDNEIGQILKSVVTAKKVRPLIKEYIICIPHNVSSQKIGRGKTITLNHEEKKINDLIGEINTEYPALTLTWWFENELLSELQHTDNEGTHKYWFEKETISLSYLKNQFNIQKQNSWLKERYTPELHSPGIIFKHYQKLILTKAYRNEVSEALQEKINVLTHCNKLIIKFLETNEYSLSIKDSLLQVHKNLEEFNHVLFSLKNAFIEGNEQFKANSIHETDIWQVTLELERLKPNHLQKSILPKLVKFLRDIHAYFLSNYISEFNHYLIQAITMIRGGAGAGKTNGLANCVEQHLQEDLPAIIIQAQNTPCLNWTEILSHALEMPGWNKNEILSAFESIAVSKDVTKANALAANSEIEDATSKVLICVDGVEENITAQTEWCSRISETLVLSQQYPRIRFLFSARDYFTKNCIDAYNEIWEEIDLPKEGDVPVWSVTDDYLKKYNIKIENYFFIKGIDSLLALKLFCQEYAGRTISSSTQVVTATRDLLRLKVERINKEFIAALQRTRVITQQPVFDALNIIAEMFYDVAEIEHSYLRSGLEQEIDKALSIYEIDIMLDFFVQHGLLIRISKVDEAAALPRTIFYYRITYQSIIESVLSEKIYYDIKQGVLDTMPDILHRPIRQSSNQFIGYNAVKTSPNQQIIQSVINRLFAEDSRLIGQDNFLQTGFTDEAIIKMQLQAISSAPYPKAISQKHIVDEMFFKGGEHQFFVLKYLIVPSSSQANKAFGSEYVHNILSQQASCFERDKLWSGLDRFEANEKREDLYSNPVNSILNEYDISVQGLSDFENYNERPLLYAWALSNINQALRNSLRVALTAWAINKPDEFLKLLDKIFICNEPQIQEDLASIMLGLASKINNVYYLKVLSEWTINNIFEKKEIYRNSVVRCGFRAIVEKAFLKGIIDETKLIKARPSPSTSLQLIKLETHNIIDADGEFYPIVHDLAWYVIKNAYDKFLEYPSQHGDSIEDNDCKEAKDLLDIYRTTYNNPDLFAYGWSLAAAIAYIRNELGLTRKQGNSWTDETHGGKSKIYTYEEKYTWLAVHYLQGYLSDYVPLHDNGQRKWLNNYLKITDILNPAEQIISVEKFDQLEEINSDWILKENLSTTIPLTGNVQEAISAWVAEEPHLDFEKWLQYNHEDFPSFDKSKKWYTLKNYTAINDASDLCHCRLIAVACLLKADEFEEFKKVIENKPDSQFWFITDLDGLSTSPEIDMYANPSDIVWMDWIEERSDSERMFLNAKESKLFYTIVELTQGTVDGEKSYIMPSKLIRRLLGVQSFSESVFENDRGEAVSLIHNKKEEFHNSQEILLADAFVLNEKLEEEGLKLIWFVDYFKEKNPLNHSTNKLKHTQKTRKYLVWRNGERYESIKFWDEYFSNHRDKIKT